MEIVEVLQQASHRRQKNGQNDTDFNVIFFCAGCFKKINVQEFNFDQVYSNTQVPTQVNKSQRESNTNQHESNTSQYESDTSQHESKTGPSSKFF